MEIRFASTEDSPHYLAGFVFSREGNDILIEVVDEKNYEKAACRINVVRFNQVADMLLSEAG